MTEITIRRATAADAAGLVELAREVGAEPEGWLISTSEWRRPGDERRFLRAVAVAACRKFSVVLTPNSDRFHRDHIHVDIGPWRKCGV